METPTLSKFLDDLKARIQILETVGLELSCHLYDPGRIKIVIYKLPHDAEITRTNYEEDGDLTTDIRLLCEWLRRRVNVLENADISNFYIMFSALSHKSQSNTFNFERCWVC